MVKMSITSCQLRVAAGVDVMSGPAQDHGKTSATASLGLITLWDVEGGLPQIDKYLYSQDPAVVAGALLGVGIINSSVQACGPRV